MVFACLLSGHQLFQTGQASERVDDYFTDIAILTQIQLPFGDITRIVRHGMRDVATRQSRHGNNRDRTSGRELDGFLVNLSQIRIQGTRHRVLRRDLIHTVGHDCQSIRIVSHVGEQHQHFFILLHSKIFGRT